MDSMELLHAVMTSVEVSEEFGISPAAVRNAAKRGDISYRHGSMGTAHVWLFPRDEATALWRDGPRRRGRKPAQATE